jgi:hypothetical protein
MGDRITETGHFCVVPIVDLHGLRRTGLPAVLFASSSVPKHQTHQKSPIRNKNKNPRAGFRVLLTPRGKRKEALKLGLRCPPRTRYVLTGDESRAFSTIEIPAQTVLRARTSISVRRVTTQKPALRGSFSIDRNSAMFALGVYSL